jgi:hypothetical protein
VAPQHNERRSRPAESSKQALEAAFHRAVQRYDFKTAVRLMARLARQKQ